MPSLISIPDVEFAGFYYPEILRELLTYLRRFRDRIGLTDENEYEVHVQMVRAFSLVGHLNNTRLDTVATELIYSTCKLLESAKVLLRLIGVELSSASPAVADVVIKLSEVTSSDIVGFIPELAEFATDSVPPIPYEVLEDGGVDLDRTDQVSYVYGLEKEKEGSAGQVSATAPDVFTRTSGDVFAAGDLGKHIFILESLNGNPRELRITEYIDADNVRVVEVPGSGSPGFQTETGLDWTLKAFTTDKATEANTGGSPFDPWVDAEDGDCLYVGHKQVLPGQIDVELDTAAANIAGVFEYFDNSLSQFFPSGVTDNGDGTITFDLTSLLGAPDRHGAEIEIEYIPTGTKERVASTFSLSANKATTQSTLGQTSVSTDIEDYLITADWVPFENQDDKTLDLTVDEAVTFNFPQDEYRNWKETEVNLVEAWWWRYRIVEVSTPTEPSIDRIKIDQGDQYMVVQATQGETIGPLVLGSSDGSSFQEFSLPESPFIDDTEMIEVDEGGSGSWTEWSRVANFLNSSETSRHYVRESSAEDVATIRFGDGENGKIPPSGTDNLRATWRIGGDIDGNVGVMEVNTNADGVSGIAEVWNPRSASGWRMKEGGSDDDLARVKRDAPAALRTRETASNEGDTERLAVKEFTDSDGVKPVARAVAQEEGFGPKTVKLLVVGAGGTTLSTSQREELEEYFNGNRESRPQVKGKITLGHHLTVVNFEPRLVQIQATVVWKGGNAESVRAALLALITPLALEEDGTTYVFEYNGYVSRSRVHAEIHSVDPGVEDVPTLLINGSSTASLSLGPNELPYTTASSIVINIQETAA